MLTKLLEELKQNDDLKTVTVGQIKPTDSLVVHIFNDDVANPKRLQILDSAEPEDAPTLTVAVNQNPTAHVADFPIPDGLFACLSSSPKQAITCAGSTNSTVVKLSEDDLFDFVIGNASYTDKTLSEMKAILATNNLDLVPMINSNLVNPVPELSPVGAGPTIQWHTSFATGTTVFKINDVLWEGSEYELPNGLSYAYMPTNPGAKAVVTNGGTELIKLEMSTDGGSHASFYYSPTNEGENDINQVNTAWQLFDQDGALIDVTNIASHQNPPAFGDMTDDQTDYGVRFYKLICYLSPEG
jgi:hypothetical protein